MLLNHQSRKPSSFGFVINGHVPLPLAVLDGKSAQSLAVSIAPKSPKNNQLAVSSVQLCRCTLQQLVLTLWASELDRRRLS